MYFIYVLFYKKTFSNSIFILILFNNIKATSFVFS